MGDDNIKVKKDKKKKIGRIIILIVFFIYFVIAATLLSLWIRQDSNDSEYITKAEWMEMLNETFGVRDRTEYPSTFAKGEYLIKSGIDMLGERRLKMLVGDSVIDEDTYLKIASDRNLFDVSKKKDKILKTEAQQYADRLLDFYNDEIFYQEYANIVWADGVIDANKWDITYNSDDSNWMNDYVNDPEAETYLIAAINGELPNIGDRITYVNSIGIAEAKVVESVEPDRNGKYKIVVSQGTDINDYIESIDFCGYADFSYIMDSLSESSTNISLLSTNNSNDDKPKKRNIEVEAKLASDDRPKLDFRIDDFSLRKASPAHFIIKDLHNLDSDEVKNELLKQDKITEKMLDTESRREAKRALANSYGGEWIKSSDYIKTEQTYKITVTLSAMDTVITCAGAIDYSDKSNTRSYANGVEFTISCNPQVTIEGEGELEGQFPLGVFRVPISSTAGIVNCYIMPYIVISEGGVASIYFGFDNPVYVGFEANMYDGVKKINDSGRFIADMTVTGKLGTGVGSDFIVALFDKEFCQLADPTIETKVEAMVKTLDPISDYECCNEAIIAAPTVNLVISSKDDSIAGKILDRWNIESEYDLVDVDHAPFRKYLHIESMNNNYEYLEEPNVIEDPLGNAAVCTHLLDEEKDKERPIISFVEKRKIEGDVITVINGVPIGWEVNREEDLGEQYLKYLESCSSGETSDDSAHTSVMTEYNGNPDGDTFLMNGDVYILPGGDISKPMFYYQEDDIGLFTIAPTTDGTVIGHVTDIKTYNAVLSNRKSDTLSIRTYLNID